MHHSYESLTPISIILPTMYTHTMKGGNYMKSKRGLASATKQTRQEVGHKGGVAYHTKRGLQAANQQTRIRVARAGGKA